VGAALLINVSGAFAYSTGTTGYDIGYLQCGTSYPAGQFGIVGVDSGWPFISSLHPGNACLAEEVAWTPDAGLYVNTGYDPSYTDINHTLTSCTTLSQNFTTLNPSYQAAWAVGCSEATKDLDYATSQNVSTQTGWWLDVETANSWCGQSGTNCSDLSLNQYTIQGLIDTFRVNSSAPVGIYSNSSMWSSITGGGWTPNGVASDWVAPGLHTGKHASSYCVPNGFAGQPVSLVQWVSSSTDRDYAC
jgi:hypothetical protein